VGPNVTDSYRQSLSDIGVSVSEEITGGTEEQVRERVQNRVTRQVNATTDLVVVASGAFQHSIAASNFPNSVTYHITTDDDIEELVNLVNSENITSVKVAGKPDLAQDAAESLREDTDADVRLVVARAAQAIRMNRNLTQANVPAFAQANRRKMQDWRQERQRLQQAVQRRANRTLTRAQNLVDANASDEAREALHEAE
ncbi:MAG: hypothetical protein ABEK12_03890, partial [Candidatus Nanohaloarchaea archaeon]